MNATPLASFLNYCRALKMSNASVSAYARSLSFFDAFLASRGKTLAQAVSADVTDFIAEHQDWSASTICNRLSALRTFYAWATIKELLPNGNPMPDVRSPKQHVKRNKPTVSGEDVQLLRDTRRTCRDGSARQGDLRDRCLIALIYDTGIRVAEVVSLNVGHITSMDPQRREFIYTGKGGSEYSWFVTIPVYELLMNYLRTHPNPEPDSPLFLNRYGGRLSQRSVQKMLHVRGEQVLGRRLHPHMLRRGFGNAFYEASGHDIYATSQAMHHCNVTTTQGYLSISGDRLKEIVDDSMGRRWTEESKASSASENS